MGSDDRDSAVYAPFDAIKRHYGYLHRIKDIREALQLAPKVINLAPRPPDSAILTVDKSDRTAEGGIGLWWTKFVGVF